MRISEKFIKDLKEDEIFVFGSNLAGKPGAGAAKFAQKFGMRYGHCEGICGNTYAIPTKDEYIKTLTLDRIEKHVSRFLCYVYENTQYKFLLTEVGCGLAGYKIEEIAPLFKKGLEYENLYFPKSFLDFYLK